MTQLVYSREELCRSHDYARPHSVAGQRLHGGFVRTVRHEYPVELVLERSEAFLHRRFVVEAYCAGGQANDPPAVATEDTVAGPDCARVDADHDHKEKFSMISSAISKLA